MEALLYIQVYKHQGNDAKIGCDTVKGNCIILIMNKKETDEKHVYGDSQDLHNQNDPLMRFLEFSLSWQTKPVID